MNNEEIQVELAKINARLAALENIVYKSKIESVAHQLAEAVPNFDPKILTEHQWKGKKLGHRHWADGSLGWGWDFIGEFPEDVIAVLAKGPLTIGESVFTLGEKVVNVQKA